MTLLLLDGEVFHARNRVWRTRCIHAGLCTSLALQLYRDLAAALSWTATLLQIVDDLAYLALPFHLAGRALRGLRVALRADADLAVQLFECLGALG